MRTPQQAMKDAIESGAVQAWIEGKKIQVRVLDKIKWEAFQLCHPEFSDPGIVWRPAPEPKLRPWKPEEVPVGCLLRTKTTGSVWLLLGCNNSGEILIAGGQFHRPEELLSVYEHSTDGGKTWAPCGVMEGVE